MTSYEALLREFEALDVQDDKALIVLLERTFQKAHDENVHELPYRNEIARLIGVGRRMLPDPELSARPPVNSNPKDSPELAAWLIQRAVNLAITAPKSGVDLSLEYWYFTEWARDYLGRGEV